MKIATMIARSVKHPSSLKGQSVASKTARRISKVPEKILNNIEFEEGIPGKIKETVQGLFKAAVETLQDVELFEKVKFKVVKYDAGIIPKGVDGKEILLPVKIEARSLDKTRKVTSEMFRWFDDAIKHLGVDNKKGTLKELIKKMAKDVTRPFGNLSTEERRAASSIITEKVDGHKLEHVLPLSEELATAEESVARYLHEFNGSNIGSRTVTSPYEWHKK